MSWFISHEKKYFTVMDYAEGGELSILLKEKKKFSENEAKNF